MQRDGDTFHNTAPIQTPLSIHCLASTICSHGVRLPSSHAAWKISLLKHYRTDNITREGRPVSYSVAFGHHVAHPLLK